MLPLSTALHAARAPSCSELQGGADQVFYHILVDARDWPGDATQPPVAYVAEECLSAGSSADFTSDQPLVVSRQQQESKQ